MIPSFLKVALKRFLLLIVAYSLCRGLFLIWNLDMFSPLPKTDLFSAFLHGLRFDTAAILITNSPLILIWLLPVRWLRRRWVSITELTLFGVVNMLCIGMNFVDTEFVKFIGKRSSFELFMLREDIQRQASSILTTYWYLLFGVLLLAALLIYLAPRFPAKPQEPGWVASALWRLALVALVVLGIRGGFQFKPLHPMDAYFTTHREIGLLVLNTPFTMIRSQARGDVSLARYFETDKEAILHLKKMTDLSREPLAVAKDWNVVVIILESWGSEYTGAPNKYQGYTPFFDELTKAPGAFYFPNSFANARRSIEGLPAVICGLPALMEAPILTSDFSNNQFECLPKVLARQGYSTYFLHGAHNGSMRFDTFAKIAGFEHFVGLNEYPKDNPEDLDKYWGVLDEPMLQYAAKTIDEAPKPVMLGIFTLSSHHPYYIPPQHRGKFPKGNLEIHESVGYTDLSLRNFFATARTKPWFNNTIFYITGDHTQKSEHKEYGGNMLGWYRVPFLIYAPGLAKTSPKTDPARIVQHIDLQPSILDLLGVKQPNRLLVGQSVFDNGRDGRAYNWTGYTYWYLDPHVVLEWARNSGELKAWNHASTWNYLEQERKSEGMDVDAAFLNLKAVVHYMNQGLLHNNLYRWKESL
ncbi:MAG: LTA synthase family protein [Bdellovibrionales bacterium]|nr:LTA synthase family protein [Bdellovibrionales bacterium]